MWGLPLFRRGVLHIRRAVHQPVIDQRWLSFASPSEYSKIADAYLEAVQEALEDNLEEHVSDLEVNLADGVLNVVLGDKGHWVINKQTPNQQIWWSSPKSGPKRFEYDSDTWVNTRDGQNLEELLRTEVREVVGVELPPLEEYL